MNYLFNIFKEEWDIPTWENIGINRIIVEVLDLSNDKIKYTFPYFLETLSKLQVFVLKLNRL
jgi:hypothetical protein